MKKLIKIVRPPEFFWKEIDKKTNTVMLSRIWFKLSGNLKGIFNRSFWENIQSELRRMLNEEID
jgi:hypothetical protein